MSNNAYITHSFTIKDEKQHPRRNDSRIVETLPFRESLLITCQKRNDEWGTQSLNLNSTCIDLVAVEGRYHKSCHTNFLLDKTPGKPKQSLGRPEDITMLTSFNSLCDWIEIEAYAELYSLGELHDKVVQIILTPLND